MEKKFYVFKSEEKRFEPVDQADIPEITDGIFLLREIYRGQGGKRGYLRLFSNSEYEIESYDGSLSDRESVKRFDENQQHIVNLAGKLSRE